MSRSERSMPEGYYRRARNGASLRFGYAGDGAAQVTDRSRSAMVMYRPLEKPFASYYLVNGVVEMQLAVLATKLYAPPERPLLVARPRLGGLLDSTLEPGHRLTLVSAPAGFGKTTVPCH